MLTPAYLCVYVGRATNIYSRLFKGSDAHLVRLKNGKHEKKKKKKAMNTSGKITIEVLEEVECKYKNYSKDMQEITAIRLDHRLCRWFG